MFDSDQWKFGKIINRTGKLHYEVEVDSRLPLRYVDQIIKTSCMSNNGHSPETWNLHPIVLREDKPTVIQPETQPSLVEAELTQFTPQIQNFDMK